MNAPLSPALRAQLLAALAGWFETPHSNSISPTPENHLLCALGAASRVPSGGPFCALFDQLWELVRGCEPGLVLHELEIEHARLFLDPSEVRIAPYEHVYCSRGVADLDRELHEIYRRHGLRVDSAVRDLADHISLELEFQARLLSEGHEQEAQAFFDEHLSSFHPRCAEQLGKRANSPFHMVVSETLNVCLQLESQVPERAERAAKQSSQTQN